MKTAGPTMQQPLRVVIEDRPLRKALTGVGNYIAQLLTHLPAVEPEIAARPFLFTHVLRRDWRPAATAAPQAPPPPKPRGDLRVPWWVRRTIQAGYDAAFRLLTHGYDLYHEPNHVPIRSGLPTVTTIHDLSVLVHPDWHPLDRVKWYESSFAVGVRQTRHFLAASEFTKSEMGRLLGVPADRVTVTYQAARDDFLNAGRLVESGGRPSLPAGFPEHFFLYVGTLEPRKNVDGLLDAFAALSPQIRARHPLLIAGAWGWKADRIREKLGERRISEHVRLLGYLHDPELAALYSHCTAFVWPTWYEGFGLPPLEALACGAPVIISQAASLPEVVGQAGTLLSPDDTDAWAAAMRTAAESLDQHETRARAAIAQARTFSWERFVRDTARGYRAALEL
ncbi:MAG: glycosyltransferase family 4 protein [Planctomycetes bacterium]|nr:glycosyltransferase family 4 protein [Planctomycetota bacterium]